MNLNINNIERQSSIILPLFIFLLSLMVYFSLSGLAYYLSPQINPLILNGVGQIFALFLPAFYSNKLFELNVNFFSSSNIFSIRNIFFVLIALILLYVFESAFSNILITIISKESYLEMYNLVEKEYSKIFAMRSPFDYAISILFAAITPAIVEEYLFRGFLLRLFLGDYKAKSLQLEDNFEYAEINKPSKKRIITAFVIVSLIFSLIHFNPLSFVMLFCFSILLCYLAFKTNSLLPSILLHFTNNLLVITSMYIKPENSESITIPEINIFASIAIAILAILSSFHIIKKLHF